MDLKKQVLLGLWQYNLSFCLRLSTAAFPLCVSVPSLLFVKTIVIGLGLTLILYDLVLTWLFFKHSISK